MAFEKVEYKFPDPDDTAKQNIEIEDSSAIEVDLSGKNEEKDEPKANGADDKGITLRKLESVYSILVKAITMKGEQKKQP